MRISHHLASLALLLQGVSGYSHTDKKAAPVPPPAPPDLTAPPADVERSPSGLLSKALKRGAGAKHPGPSDYVALNYTGWTADGKAFDSTWTRTHPWTLGVGRVMKGMSEGLQLMAVGETRRMWIPESLAFAGAKGRPKGDLVLDVELVGFDPPPTQAPAEVAQPPAEALLTSSGLRYLPLRHGPGKLHPSKRSLLTVHYTGWTTDGKMFDSSVLRGSPAEFRLDEVIKGWIEGLQLMVEGDKFRFWIPEKLAYHGEIGKPGGILVFDVELLEFSQ